MLNWEERFTNAPGPVTYRREVVDTPAPTPMGTAFETGHLRNGGAIRDFPKPRAFNNQPAKLPKKRRRSGYRTVEPLGDCDRIEGHEWKSKGTDLAGTRLVRCPHCKRATTAANAGVELPYRKRDHTLVVPVGGEPACIDPRDHRWMRNGTVRGVQRIVCRWCRVKSRQAEES